MATRTNQIGRMRRRRLAVAAIVAFGLARAVAAFLLFAGPWTDEASELAGWDAERFANIAAANGQPWAEHEVEYPPGSVLAFEGLARLGERLQPAGASPVGMNRALVLIGLGADGLCAVVIWRRNHRAAVAYLAVGTALLPMGYLRLDLVTVLLATVAAVALIEPPTAVGTGRAKGAAAMILALAVVAGAAIKIWPVLLLLPAIALGRWRAVTAAAMLGTLAGMAWLVWVGAWLDPIDQVVSLRGATGWHVESLPGALVALFTSTEARFELNAFRIGQLRPAVATAGRLAALAVFATLVIRGRQARATEEAAVTLSRVMLGATAALLATSALLSPQFLLWLTPWLAFGLASQGSHQPDRSLIAAAWCATGAVAITGIVLGIAGPSGVDATPAAFGLTLRNLLLVATVAFCLLPSRGLLVSPQAGD